MLESPWLCVMSDARGSPFSKITMSGSKLRHAAPPWDWLVHIYTCPHLSEDLNQMQVQIRRATMSLIEQPTCECNNVETTYSRRNPRSLSKKTQRCYNSLIVCVSGPSIGGSGGVKRESTQKTITVFLYTRQPRFSIWKPTKKHRKS